MSADTNGFPVRNSNGSESGRESCRVLLLAVGNANTRWRLRQPLAEQGFVVYAVGDGRAALEWLERRVPDAVIADLLLPGTRIALPHVLRRRGRTHWPRMIGLTDTITPTPEVQRAFAYDLVLPSDTPTAVIVKSLFQLLATRA